jgi:hypothetical protein
MTDSMQQLNGRAFGGAKIALPTSYPTWCEVDTHQEILDDLLHDPADPGDLGARAVGEPANLKDQAAKHRAPARSNCNLELRTHHGEMIRTRGGRWMLTLGQIPTKDTSVAGGWLFVPMTTSDDPATQGVRLRGGRR